ncbi:MAG TPA: MFS transporter [Burkholderiales bacterium]|nr:MFS transporter [Burkholderiales bacterium]
MTVYLVVLLSILNSIGQRGSKVAISLYALELGAGAAAVGVLAALFATFPLLLAVQAGKISDRFGVRIPIICGALTMAAGLAVAYTVSDIHWLFVCPALIGLGHIFFHVSIHNLVGSLGADAERTRNFATFALGSSLAAFVGPSLAGFAIDLAGFRAAFAILAAVAGVPALIVLLYRSLIPTRMRHEEEEQARSAFDLLAIPALRRTLIMSGVTLTGIELFSFYLPIYGRSIGLAPSVIGMILSSYAVAGFIVRSFMHRLAQRYTEVGVLTGSLFVAALAYFIVPGLADGWLLAAAAFALGLALGSAQPLTIILTYNHAPAGRSGEALGMRIMANKVTQIAVPLAFGGFGAALGAVPVFLATGAFLLVAGLTSLKR